MTRGHSAPQVPPMPAAQAVAVMEAELAGRPLDDIFEWINLDTPLGSASIAQVRSHAGVAREGLGQEPRGRQAGWLHQAGLSCGRRSGCPASKLVLIHVVSTHTDPLTPAMMTSLGCALRTSVDTW
jgi:hypothetical protein